MNEPIAWIDLTDLQRVQVVTTIAAKLQVDVDALGRLVELAAPRIIWREVSFSLEQESCQVLTLLLRTYGVPPPSGDA